MASEPWQKGMVTWAAIVFTAMVFVGDIATRYWSANVTELAEDIRTLKTATKELTIRLDALPQPTALNSLSARVDQLRDGQADARVDIGQIRTAIDNLQRATGSNPYQPLPLRQPERR